MATKNLGLYPYTKLKCCSHSVANGSTSFRLDNLFQGQTPEKVIIGLIKSNVLNDEYTTNPFNFENFGIKRGALYHMTSRLGVK